MTRGKSKVNLIGRNQGGMKQRAAYYEDYAKPVLVNWPFMVVAAAALFVVGHFANKRAGRRTGGSGKSSPSDDTNNPVQNDEGLPRGGNRPMSLAELRARRVEAAEARTRHGTTASNPGVAKPTPLGRILSLTREVDKLEKEASAFLASVKELEGLDAASEKEHSRLLELLTQVQLKIDGIQSDESVRPHRKTQTQRVQSLTLELEAVDKKTA
ncbi:hypothetical protein MPTK1_3g19280 [Marchantia polymorpha subsp. ruderalis]|uniref:BAG domain-containing protein n=2 Tax=Marchantia polymorpha TaxID=3197 RepID=A0A176WH34_MARPO|nr:hypothetical protein AXG93_2153s1040 [Marchantia polymorpha subsp. ruderalis]PTQ38830.1 hypothetical protein MARPO_0049s0106 [Marchantia polymorpha]BBN06213.1 hypothetical protein Mp_3g19280 [Marchantia polymorpha subsp. ruderalis]|eukprot:PTQ38830.1 hypothetical protein MARPO_0049s0106 [Marchantia polymorpha]